MKSFFSLSIFILLFCTGNVFSQTILTRANYFSRDSIYPFVQLTNVEYDSIAYQGNGVTWDLSNISSNGVFDTMSSLNPTITPFYNQPSVNYHLSDLCLFYPNGTTSGGIDDNSYHYFISNQDSVSFLGNWANNGMNELVDYHLTDPELFFHFPLSYGDSITDSLKGSAYDMSGLGLFDIKGSKTIQYDGFGTLIIPGYTYKNCIRIKTVKNSTWTMQWGPIVMNETHYYWFVDSLNGPVLELVAGNNTVTDVIYYCFNPTVGTNELTYNTSSVILYPNPAQDLLNIKINNPPPHNLHIELTDLSGRILYATFSDKQFTQLDISALKSGLYIAHVADGENHSSSRFIKL